MGVLPARSCRDMLAMSKADIAIKGGGQ